MKRVFLFVLDSCGIGAMPDAKAFGDGDVNTLRSCASTGKLNIPNMLAAGIQKVRSIGHSTYTKRVQNDQKYTFHKHSSHRRVG